MEKKPLLIKRIDLLVHPFYNPGYHDGTPIPYNENEARELLEIWKGHVNEVAKEPNRLFLVSPISWQADWQKNLSEELFDYAKQKLGKRFTFFWASPGFPFEDGKGEKFKKFEDFIKENYFIVDAEKVKTRGMGEYPLKCVMGWLTNLNVHIGLKNVIPYRNRQSSIILRKSVGDYFKPWLIKELMKSPKGRRRMRWLAKKYIKKRLKRANELAWIHWREKKPFKLRSKRR